MKWGVNLLKAQKPCAQCTVHVLAARHVFDEVSIITNTLTPSEEMAEAQESHSSFFLSSSLQRRRITAP